MLSRLVLGAFAVAAPLAPVSAQVDWRPLTPAVTPPARAAHAMAFDPIHDRIVLFGGQDNTSTRLRDTWLYDGTTWTQTNPATSPPARAGHFMAYDPIRGRVVLFGGYGSGITRGDTREWDGQNWVRRTR